MSQAQSQQYDPLRPPTISRDQQLTGTVRKALDYFAQGFSDQHDCERETWVLTARTHLQCAREALLNIDQRILELVADGDGEVALRPAADASSPAADDAGGLPADGEVLELTPAGEAALEAAAPAPAAPISEQRRRLAALSTAELLAEADEMEETIVRLTRELGLAREDLAVEVRQRDCYVRQHARCVDIVHIARAIGERMTGPCGVGLFTQLSAELDHNPESEF